MKKILLSLAALLVFGAGCNQPIITTTNTSTSTSTDSVKTRIVETQMTQVWVPESGNFAGFESIVFYEDGSYSSFLHDRPFEDGTWTFKDNNLTISSSSGTTSVLKDVGLKGNKLSMMFENEENIWIPSL